MTGINAKRAVERCEKLAALGPAPPQSRPWKLRQWLRAYRAIMALDITEQAEVLREVYTDEKLRAMAEAPNPFIKFLSEPVREGPRMRRWVEPVDHQQHGAAMTPDEIARRGGR